jgi:hypothetical protein
MAAKRASAEDKDKALERVRKFVRLAASSKSQHERHSAIDRAFEALEKAGLSAGDLFSATSQVAPKKDPIATAAAATTYVKEVAADPNVQRAVSGLRDVAQAGASILDALRSRR